MGATQKRGVLGTGQVKKGVLGTGQARKRGVFAAANTCTGHICECPPSQYILVGEYRGTSKKGDLRHGHNPKKRGLRHV